MMTPAMREDLAGREQDIQRGKTVELLRRAGREMYDNPIVNTAIGFTPVLGDVQAAGETMAAFNRGAPWQETAGYAAGMLPFVPMIGKTVWHGSPHTFDKFDLSKIGTGEGAQAYGHGLYLAEARPTAEEYARMNLKGPSQVAHVAAKGPISPMDTLKMVYPNKPDEFYDAAIKGAGEPGQLYKVDLPDEQIAKMLDWDKPFSEQPKNVQDAITKYWSENRVYGDPTKLTGEGIYGSVQGHVLGNRGSDIANRSASQEAASMDLNYMGIPGIQYLDQASRGAGDGTRNYVVFSDEIPQILERNGTPLGNAVREYRGAHTAPGPEFGAPLHDLTGGGDFYPENVYSPKAARLYGSGDAIDQQSVAIAQRMRNKPDEMVDIYRAVPNEADITAINPGDWVTINPNYAKQHGESNLPEGYKILSQKVPAKSVWTNADSIHEYGYWPETE